uniref:START domain-containing protein n=1 Tax=Panagrellus redivivus TaxID=6233 RepID=A0A7E4VAX7_PANRE
MSKYGIPPLADTSATYADEDYIDLGNKIAKQLDLLRQPNGWNLTNSGDEHCTIYTRKNGLPEAKENMLLLTTEMPAPLFVVEKLLAPWGNYRLLWDDLLDDIAVLATMPEETYIVHHLVKKRITLSVRESVDLVQVHRSHNRVMFASCGTSHGSTPATRNYTRTHQYIGGYILDVVSDTSTRVTMIFHADLNLPGPKIMTSLADRFKPKLMLDNARALRSGIKKYQDDIIANLKDKDQRVANGVTA